MKKQIFTLLISFLLISGIANGQPNIILIMADDLGWTDLSTPNSSMENESKYYETPNIDNLANQGMAFSYAYTQQNCQPTRAALLMGQYATGPQNGVYNVSSLHRASDPDNTPIIPHDQKKHLREQSISVFETLKTAGYHTAWFGKFHALKTGEEASMYHGVDHNLALRKETRAIVNGVQVKNEFFAQNDDTKGWKFSHNGLNQYAQPYDSAYITDVLEPCQNGNDPWLVKGSPKHLTDALGDAVVDYIKDRAQEGTPFFAYVPFHAVHVSILPRLDLEEKYKAKTSSDPRHNRADYAAFIELLDQNVGRIVDALDDPNGDGDKTDGIAQNTLVVFYSDNGGFMGPTDNSPLRLKKGTYYEGGLRVPLIFRWPDIIDPNSVNNIQEVHAIDLYPTFADIAGANLPDPSVQEIDGKSIAGILKGETDNLDSKRELFWHFPGYMDTRNLPQSVIHLRHTDNKHYKLFYRYEDGTYEMYNLSDDIGETTNLLKASPDQATIDIARMMNNKLRDWLIFRNAPAGTWRDTGKSVPYPPYNMDHSSNQIKPKVSFIQPGGDTTINLGYSELLLEVKATDTDGSIRSVKLFIDEELIGEKELAPFVWGNDGRSDLLRLDLGDHIVKAIATDNIGNTSEASITLRLEQIANYDKSLDNNSTARISIFPNPTTKFVSVKGLHEKLQIRIMDLSGNLYYTGLLDNKLSNIDVSHYPEGIYLLKAFVGYESTYLKIIKNQ